MEEANASSLSESKHYRQRKKQLYNDILQQMEFYLSDANLSKDRFLAKQIQQDPHIDISIFLRFNKLKKLTTDVKDVQKALKNSELIELSDDKTKISRKTPITQKTDVDECTIYVERLPSDAEHEWVQNLFSRFGAVDYISIPKYKHNSMIKGFAFVEFDKPETAKKALDYFESIGGKLPSEMAPDHLCSIKTFDAEDNKVKGKNVVEVVNENVLHKENQIDNVEENRGLKRKLDADIICENKKQKQNEVDEISPPDEIINKFDENMITEGSTAVEANLPTESLNEEEKQKKKRKRKKTNKQKQDIKEIGLQILSKLEWKKMRNKYLCLQKSKMKKLKQHLYNLRFSKNGHFKVPVNEKQESEETPLVPKIQFQPGVIVHLKFQEPIEEIKKMKAKLKSYSANIQYVDAEPDFQNVYVRFSENEEAQKFCKSDLEAEPTLLEGDSEQKYWKKIIEDRNKKENKDVSKTKQRGREKLLRKAEKELGKHIRFDNDD